MSKNIYQILNSVEYEKKTKQPVVLIDLSNFIFHRFHAVSAWSKISKNEFESDKEYIEMYERMFEKHLMNIKKKCKCEWENLFLVADCPREDIWRNKYYPEYKKNRDLRVKQDLIPEIFNKTYSELIPRLYAEHKFNLLKISNAEADDVIGIIKTYVRQKYPNRLIVIISNDNDYIQLVDNNTKIYNHAFKNLLDRIPKEIREHCCMDIIGKIFLTYKILKGDTSDNITPVTRGSVKKCIELAINNDQLIKAKTEKKFYELFNRNNLLINLDMTPFEIKELVSEKLKTI